MDLLLSISTDLSLRVVRPSEAGALFSLVQKNRRHLRRWLPWVDQMQIPYDARRFLEASYAGYLQRGGFNFGIRYRGSLVGLIGFHGFDYANRVTSIGYWLAESHCGQGIMRQAVVACVEYAFQEREMNRLFIRSAPGNERSRRISEVLGFVYEGRQREAEWLHDQFVDLDVFSLLAREWRAAGTQREREKS